MVAAARLLPDPERSLVERLGRRIAALFQVQIGQVVEDGGDEGMVWPVCLLGNPQGAFVERLGSHMAALFLVQEGEVVEQCPDIRMFRPELLLTQLQRLLSEGFRLAVPAVGVQHLVTVVGIQKCRQLRQGEPGPERHQKT